MPGRSIRIFLVDGTSSGVRTAELGLSTIKSLVVPRASLATVKDRWEVTKTGLYILIGPDQENVGQRRIYVGETEGIFTRLAAHDKDPEKQFWEQAVVFVSKDENLTKAHVRYLEARLIKLAGDAKRATVANGTAPPDQGRLPEADEADMEEFILQARLLLGALGYEIFEPSQVVAAPAAEEVSLPPSTLPLFRFTGDHFDAMCVVDLNAGQFVVQKGSVARKQETPSLQPTYKALRAQLIHSGVLVDEDADSFQFSQDYSFGAATPAAQVVSGSTVNGRAVWRAETDNRTFAEWQDSLLPHKEGS
jgi:Domain of unknown function (DUF4357)